MTSFTEPLIVATSGLSMLPRRPGGKNANAVGMIMTEAMAALHVPLRRRTDSMAGD